jgi:hypothetical protein
VKGGNGLTETIEERIALREKILFDLYDYHFINIGSEYRTNSDELKKAPEENLAYDYLDQKGLIKVKRLNQSLLIKITAQGIDFCETKILKEIQRV